MSNTNTTLDVINHRIISRRDFLKFSIGSTLLLGTTKEAEAFWNFLVQGVYFFARRFIFKQIVKKTVKVIARRTIRSIKPKRILKGSAGLSVSRKANANAKIYDSKLLDFGIDTTVDLLSDVILKPYETRTGSLVIHNDSPSEDKKTGEIHLKIYDICQGKSIYITSIESIVIPSESVLVLDVNIKTTSSGVRLIHGSYGHNGENKINKSGRIITRTGNESVQDIINEHAKYYDKFCS